MGLESGTTISDFDTANPLGATDLINQGDDHIRLIKTILVSTFRKANDTPWDSGIKVNPADVQNGFIPIGGIIAWGGLIANIPSNWKFCDGTFGTPDLRNVSIIGAYADSGGAAKTTVTGSPTVSGGSKDSVVVAHIHTATSVVTDPGHAHTVNRINNLYGTGSANATSATANATPNTSTNTTGITVATTVDSTGVSGTNANLHPYYSLAFIQRVS